MNDRLTATNDETPGAGEPTVHEDETPPDRRGTYAAVLVLEAAVIAALWAFSSHFGG